jgi:hypothetical protein
MRFSIIVIPLYLRGTGSEAPCTHQIPRMFKSFI